MRVEERWPGSQEGGEKKGWSGGLLWLEDPILNGTLMAFREPLKSMLCDETSVQTGLSWARIVLTFCKV